MIDYALRKRIRQTYRPDPNHPGEHPATRRARLAVSALNAAKHRLAESQRQVESAAHDVSAALLAHQKAGIEPIADGQGWIDHWRNNLDYA